MRILLAFLRFLLFRTQNDFMDLQHAGTGEHLRRRAVAMSNTKGLAIGPVPEVLLTLPIRLYQIIPLFRFLFPLTSLMTKVTLYGAQHLVFNESRRTIDEMGAMAEAVFEFGLTAWRNRNAISDDEHEGPPLHMEFSLSTDRRIATIRQVPYA